MVKDNAFLRRLEIDEPTYVFHHLYQSFLQEQARVNLSSKEQKEILIKAGDWYITRNFPEKGLDYYLRAEEYSLAEKAIRRAGLDLIAANRLVTLQVILEKIPETIIHSWPWLSYFLGVAQFNTDPSNAQKNLKSARKSFVIDKDDIGELLASTSLIIYHHVVDCIYRVGERYLPRTIELFDAYGETVPVSARIQVP